MKERTVGGGTRGNDDGSTMGGGAVWGNNDAVHDAQNPSITCLFLELHWHQP